MSRSKLLQLTLVVALALSLLGFASVQPVDAPLEGETIVLDDGHLREASNPLAVDGYEFDVEDAVVYEAPFQQVSDPLNVDGYVVYGVPWVVVGLVIIGLLRRYAGLNEEGSVLVSAGWAAVGYLLVSNLPDLEQVAPWLPKYVPQVLWVVLVFGSQLGLVPGRTAQRVFSVATRAFGRRS